MAGKIALGIILIIALIYAVLCVWAKSMSDAP